MTTQKEADEWASLLVQLENILGQLSTIRGGLQDEQLDLEKDGDELTEIEKAIDIFLDDTDALPNMEDERSDLVGATFPITDI